MQINKISRKIKNRFKKSDKLIFAGFFAILVLIAAPFALKFANAATTYQISDVGTITDFQMLNASGNSIEGATFPFADAIKPASTLSISGSINSDTMNSLQEGDTVVIQIIESSTSTYYFGGFNQLGAVLEDINGNIVFNVTRSGRGIVLTRTANSTPGGQLNFTINAKIPAAGLVLNNYKSTSTTWTVGDISITFKNTAKAEVACTTQSVGRNFSSYNGAIGYMDFVQSSQMCQVYNEILAGGDVLAKFPELDKNYAHVVIVEPNEGILGLGWQDKSSNIFDILSDGVTLNKGYNITASLNSIAPMTKDNIPADLSMEDALIAQANKPVGTYSAVRNSDGSWTFAANYGNPLGLLGTNGSPSYYKYTQSNLNLVTNSKFFNSDINIEKNRNLIAYAMNNSILPENINNGFVIDMADHSVSTTLNATVCSTLSPTCSSASGTTIAESTNSAAGQTAIKVHYVDINGNALSSVSTTYGWPSDTNSGNASTDPISASPLATNPEGYQLVTDQTALANFANNQAVDVSNVLSSTTSVSYPTLASGIAVSDVYFVYAPTYNVTFDAQGGDLGSDTNTQTIIQDTGSKTASEPLSPTYTGYTFNYWYVCGGDTSTAFNFSTPITSNIDLCAQWVVNSEKPANNEQPSNITQPVIVAPNTGFMNKSKTYLNPLVYVVTALFVVLIAKSYKTLKSRK